MVKVRATEAEEGAVEFEQGDRVRIRVKATETEQGAISSLVPDQFWSESSAHV